MTEKRYNELHGRSDTRLMVEEIILPAEPWQVIGFTKDEKTLAILYGGPEHGGEGTLGMKNLDLPGPVVNVMVDPQDKKKVGVLFWKVA